MFENKKESLFDAPARKGVTTNGFVNSGLKRSSETVSTNGAKKYSTTGNDFIDQFSKLGEYRKPRNFDVISKDTSILWAQDKRITVMFILFIRLISRITSLWDGSKTKDVQKGPGNRHEGIMRMIWLHATAPDVFWKNIRAFISVGSWRDIFDMLRYDLEYHKWEGRVLDWEKFAALILAGLENPHTSELIKKYMPQIQSEKKCTTIHSQANTIIGKWLSRVIFKEYNSKKYRLLKSSGKAHEWQQLISQELYKRLDFDKVHGRALLLMVSSKFIDNHNLRERYEKWIDSKPVAKFTGFVHELAQKITGSLKPYQVKTLNKQFDGLVELAQRNVNVDSGLIVVRDCSGSMASKVIGLDVSSDHVARSLAVFFSAMLRGPFKDSWIEFSQSAILNRYRGKDFVTRFQEAVANGYQANTNFMSVLNVFIGAKKDGVREDEFPKGILCVSDWEFDPAVLNKTNVEAFREGLRRAGFSREYCDNFKIVLWNIANTFSHPRSRGYKGVKFETYGDVKNVFYLSGYDPSIIGFLLGGGKAEKRAPESPEELFEAAMSQEILESVQV